MFPPEIKCPVPFSRVWAPGLWSLYLKSWLIFGSHREVPSWNLAGLVHHWSTHVRSWISLHCLLEIISWKGRRNLWSRQRWKSDHWITYWYEIIIMRWLPVTSSHMGSINIFSCLSCNKKTLSWPVSIMTSKCKTPMTMKLCSSKHVLVHCTSF